MKKIVSLAICISLMICCLSGCKNDSKSGNVNADGMKIFISVSQADDFRGAFAQKAKELAEKSGAQVEVVDEKNSIETQVSDIKKAVSEKYDAIICGLVDIDTAFEVEALAGDMAFTVYQSATGQGEMAVKAAIDLANGGDLSGFKGVTKDKKYVWVPFEKVDSSNVKDYE